MPVEASLTNCCSGHAPLHAYDIITMTLQGLVVRPLPVHLKMVSLFASSLWSPQISLSSPILADCQWWKKVPFRFFKNYSPLLLLYLYLLKYCGWFRCDVRTPDEALRLSLSVSDRPVHRCSGRSLTESDDTRSCVNTIWPPEDEQDIARNMYV